MNILAENEFSKVTYAISMDVAVPATYTAESIEAHIREALESVGMEYVGSYMEIVNLDE